MRIYDSILEHIKPPPGAAQFHYTDAFDRYFSLTLRERRWVKLIDMMNDVIEVKVNLIASGKIKQKLDFDKKKSKEEGQPSSSYFSDAMFDTMIKVVESSGWEAYSCTTTRSKNKKS